MLIHLHYVLSRVPGVLEGWAVPGDILLIDQDWIRGTSSASAATRSEIKIRGNIEEGRAAVPVLKEVLMETLPAAAYQGRARGYLVSLATTVTTEFMHQRLNIHTKASHNSNAGLVGRCIKRICRRGHTGEKPIWVYHLWQWLKVLATLGQHQRCVRVNFNTRKNDQRDI